MINSKSFSSSADLQNFLLETADPHTLVTVPHQRLAHQLWHRQRLMKLEAGRRAWEPINCLTLQGWWRELWRHLWFPEIPAPPLKRLTLWRRAIEACPPLEGTQPDLQWAGALDEAYDTLCRHELPLTESQTDDPPLVAWRRRVTRIYEELLQEEKLLAPAQIASRLLKALENRQLSLPPRVIVVGLETPAPTEAAWLEAVGKRTQVMRLQVKGNPEVVRDARVLPNPDEELAWVAAKLVEFHHRDQIPLHRLAVTSPAMDSYSPRFRRMLRELLGPAAQNGQWAYNFSAGPRLAEAPLFTAALLPLQFAAQGERREDLVSLILSPYFRVLSNEQHRIVHWDRLFREQRLTQGWARLRAAVVEHVKPKPELLDCLDKAFGGFPAAAGTLQDWLESLSSTWRHLGFPGDLNDAETLQFSRLGNLLQDLAQALYDETLSAGDFLEWLTHGAWEIILPGEGVQEAGLQVLGLLEMRGLDFDRVFCLGMNSGAFPAPPRPLILLSPQEKRRTLGGTYESQHRFAEEIYENLLGTAPHLTLTRPGIVDDEDQVGTHLWVGPWRPNNLAMLNRPHPAWLLSPAVEAAFATPEGTPAAPQRTEAVVLPLPPELRITQIQTALTCPCRFLLEVLLGIQDLPDIQAGLPPLERGSLLHKVLARFVGKFREILDRHRDWHEAEAQRLLEESAAEVLGPLSDPHWEAELTRWLGKAGLSPGLLSYWLALEKERYDQGWRWRGVEVAFQGLTLKDWPFSLRGRIDRFDCHPELEEGIVWDYKSGNVPSGVQVFHRLEESQLPGYLAAVKRGLVEVGGEAASLRAGFIGLKSIRDDHLRHQNYGKNAQHWKDVVTAWEERVTEAARCLLAGDFRPDPRPAPVKKNQGACQYCSYLLVCGFDPDDLKEPDRGEA